MKNILPVSISSAVYNQLFAKFPLLKKMQSQTVNTEKLRIRKTFVQKSFSYNFDELDPVRPDLISSLLRLKLLN